MKRLMLAVAVAATLPVAGNSSASIYEQSFSKTVMIDVPFPSTQYPNAISFCSATVVAKNTILTARHCFPADGVAPDLKVSGKAAKILKSEVDGEDHILIVTDIAYPSWARMSKTPPKVGDDIFYFGRPVGSPGLLLRKGYISEVEPEGLTVDINLWKGDSGAGVFNEDGQVVGVVNIMWLVDLFRMAGCRTLAFKDTQYENMGVK